MSRFIAFWSVVALISLGVHDYRQMKKPGVVCTSQIPPGSTVVEHPSKTIDWKDLK